MEINESVAYWSKRCAEMIVKRRPIVMMRDL